MNRIVADASFCGSWIMPDETSDAADALLEELISGSVKLVIPALWHYEMANLLRSGYGRGRLTKAGMRAAAKTLTQVPIHEVDIPQSAQYIRILELAAQFGLSAYDAAYLELSDRLNAPLKTADKALLVAHKGLS